MAKVNHAAAVRLYVRLVKAGRMEMDDVPEKYRADVQAKLDPWGD